MVVYSTSAKVSQLLQVEAFSASTIPTQTTVEDFLLRAEREIEHRTNRAWQTRKTTDYETRDYEYHDIHPSNAPYSYVHKLRVYLRHPNLITPLAAVPGDSLGVWKGSSWEEWVGVKTEDRNGDFWVNADEGILYLNRSIPLFRYPDGIRIRYRYGHTQVDPWVEEVATKIAAISVLEGFKQYSDSNVGLVKADINQTISAWRKEVDSKLDENKWLSRDKRPLVL